MNMVQVSLVAAECRHAMNAIEGFDAKVTAALGAAAHHWMVLDHDLQFKGALAALLDAYDEDTPEGKRLRREVDDLKKGAALIHALQAGLPVNTEAMLAELDGREPHEPIGLQERFRKVAT